MAIDTIKSTAVLDGAIATADIADDAVTADKLANAINTSIAAKAPIASPTFTGTTTANLLASNGTILGLQTNGTAVGGIGTLGGATYFGSQQSGIMFNGVNQNPTNGTSTRVDNTNDLGAQSYRYKDIYLGGGVFLGGTSTPNKLDDYETGSWTPTWIASSGSFGTIAYANRDAKYVKVGNVVHVIGEFYTTGITIGTATGELRIGGLPFTNGMAGNGVASLKGDIRLFSGEVPWAGNVSEGTTYIALYYKTSITGSSQASQVVDLATSGTGNIIGISASYYVS